VNILVVDDDRLVRRFMTESLRTLGYQVADAADGQSAVDLLKETAFDLLIVDFAMPGMNGAEVARLARSLRPALRILIVSGYADSTALQTAVGNAPQLRKPFNTADLQAAVRDLFAREEP
jgi:CheY-like chemotaxis protein